MPRARGRLASTAPRTPRIVTTRTPLFDEAGSREDGADLGEMRSGLFLQHKLDDPNHVELAREIRSLAQRVLAHFCRAISSVGRAGQTNCRRLDQVEQFGNPLTILSSTETLRLDPETRAGDTRNCHFHKTICSTQGGLHTAQAPPGEVRLLHSQISHRLARQREGVVQLRIRDRCAKTYCEPSLATLRTVSSPET
jgi:hypothetical protein